MKRLLFAVPFLLGAVAVLVIAATFLDQPVAFAVTLLIAAVYGFGFNELLRFRRDTGQLTEQLNRLPADRDGLHRWLDALPVSLRHPVQRRIDGHPVALPGPVMTPFLSGLLVMLGLLGTFIGMIVTLKGAATALDGSTELSAIRNALSAPIEGLSLAFGTSIAGVAASAMLGLTAALCRRDRLRTSRLLDNQVDGALQPFSASHQRQATFDALQRQSESFPALIDALQSLSERMAAMGSELSGSLTGNQQAFHDTLTDQYQDLARSVGQSLKETLADSSKLAVESIQPIMEQSLAGLSRQVESTHEKLNAITEKQLGTLTEQFRATTEQAAKEWRDGLAEHQQTSARLVSDVSTSLAQHHDQFRSNSNTLLEQVRATQQQVSAASEQQLAAISEQFRNATEQALQQWQAGLSEQGNQAGELLQQVRDTQQQLAERSEQQLASIAGDFRAASEQAARHWQQGMADQQQHSSTMLAELRTALESHQQQFGEQSQALLSGQGEGLQALLAGVRDELNALREAEAQRGDAAAERLAALEGTVSEHLAQLGTALEAPMTRLIETASETPKAAAEVISRLREEMTRSSERDNELLEERRRIMAELDRLLTSQREAASAQREAIETLISRSSETLAQVSNTFTQQVSEQGERLSAVASDVTGSAAEVASLSDGFAAAVTAFGESNNQLLDNLQQVENALTQSAARADEQLNYYVAQAREVIELSMASQRDVIDALSTLRGNGSANGANPTNGERLAAEVN